MTTRCVLAEQLQPSPVYRGPARWRRKNERMVVRGVQRRSGQVCCCLCKCLQCQHARPGHDVCYAYESAAQVLLRSHEANSRVPRSCEGVTCFFVAATKLFAFIMIPGKERVKSSLTNAALGSASQCGRTYMLVDLLACGCPLPVKFSTMVLIRHNRQKYQCNR